MVPFVFPCGNMNGTECLSENMKRFEKCSKCKVLDSA